MFGLTQQERKALLFLLAVILFGIGLHLLFKKDPPVKILPYLYQDIGKIRLNKADKNMLMNVSGIGEKLAVRILEYRKEQGGFKSIEELKNIKGINNYRYGKIKDQFLLD